MHLVMLFLLEGVQRKEKKEIDGFHLAANMEDAGDFDDVVFKYKHKDRNGLQRSGIIFLKTRHKDNVEKEPITMDKLLSESEKDFSLKKFYSSYDKVKKQFPNRSHPIFHGEFKNANCEFIIYTNASSQFDESRDGIERESLDRKSILFLEGKSESNCYHKITYDANKNDTRIADVLQYSSHSMQLANALVSSIFSPKVMNFDVGILKEYCAPLSDEVLQRKTESKEEGKIRDSFLSDETSEFRAAFFKELRKRRTEFSSKSSHEIKSELGKKILKLPHSFGRKIPRKGKYPSSLPNDFVSDDDAREFLSKLKFLVGQPNEAELSEILKQKIQSAYRVEESDIDTVYSDVKIKVERWWKDGDEYLTENNKFFQVSARVSVRFDVRDPVEIFTGREKELVDLHEALLRNQGKDKLTGISQITSISGLGGVGKSELARKYVHQYAKSYDDNIIWINAESYATLAESFRRLARLRLKLSTQSVEGREKDIRSVVEDTYKYFSNRRSLFIFDNTEKYETHEDGDAGIDKFLPLLPPSNRPVILITSRNQEWGKGVEKISLDVFNEREAETFIRRALAIGEFQQGDEVQDLADTLQRFPLALQQATAYIRKENAKGDFSIRQYLEQYRAEETEAKSLLDFRISDVSSYTKTTFITWKITLEKIKQTDHGDDALDIMDTMAYFAPNQISTKLFLSWISDKSELGSVLQLLKQYSMINVVQGEASVHRLVQQVTRIELKLKKRETEVIRKVLSLLEGYMIEGGYPVGSTHASHAVSAWGYASEHKELVKEFSELPWHITTRLIEGVRYEEAYAFGEKSSELLSVILGPEHQDSITTQGTVALILDRQGKYDEAFCVYENIFAKFKRVLGPDHPNTLTTKNNQAAVLYNQGKFDKALHAYREIFDKFKDIFGGDHPDTLAVLNNIASVLDNQGNFDEALKIYQDVLQKREEQLGPDNPSTLYTMHNIASVLRMAGKYGESLKAYREVLEKSKIILGLHHPFTLSVMNNMATIISVQGDSREALNILNVVFEHEKKILGPEHPDTLTTMHEIATQLHEQGYREESLKMHQEVLKRKQRVLGPAHPSTLDTMRNLASVLESAGAYDAAMRTLQEVLEKTTGIFGLHHPSTLNTMVIIASVLKRQGNYSKSFKVYEEVLEKRKKSLGPDHPDTVVVEMEIAGSLLSQGKYKDAMKAYQKVLVKSEHILGPDHPYTLSATGNMALLLERQGKYHLAVKCYEAVLDRQIHSLGPDNPAVLGTRNNLASVLDNQGNYDAALQHYDEVLNKRKLILGADHPSTVSTMFQRALVLDHKGEHEKALKASQDALDKMRKVLGPDHPDTLSAMSEMATILDNQGNYGEALRILEKVIPKFEQILGHDHPYTLSVMNNRAIILSKQRNFSDALINFQMVLDKFKQFLDPDHQNILSTMDNMAALRGDQGQYDEAHKIYVEVLEKRTKKLGPDHPDTLDTKVNIAGVLCKNGNYGDALGAYREVLDKRKRLLAQDHPDTLATEESIADVLCEMGNHDEALKSYGELLEKLEQVFGIENQRTLSVRDKITSVLRERKQNDSRI